jgi:hypothetical protein
VVRQRGVTRCHFSLPRCPALDSSGAGFRVFCPASLRSGPPGARGWQQFGRARSRRGGPSRRAALPAYATTTNYYYYYYIALGGIYRNCVAAGQAGHPHERAPDHRRPGAQASGDGGGATRRRPRRSGLGARGDCRAIEGHPARVARWEPSCPGSAVARRRVHRSAVHPRRGDRSPIGRGWRRIADGWISTNRAYPHGAW